MHPTFCDDIVLLFTTLYIESYIQFGLPLDLIRSAIGSTEDVIVRKYHTTR